jgi:hypothetical protein
MTIWVILAGVIVIAVAMYYLERGPQGLDGQRRSDAWATNKIPLGQISELQGH